MKLTFDPESGTLGVNFLGERRKLQLHGDQQRWKGDSNNFVTFGSVLTVPIQPADRCPSQFPDREPDVWVVPAL